MEDYAVVVKDLHKEFILPQFRHTSVKQIFVNLGRRGVKKHQKVLDGISFDVHKGDFFGIVGRNGSGKSTLLKILAGVYAPTSGVVEVYGQLTPFIELGVGFNPELTARDNVFLNGALLGFSRKEMLGLYDEIVEFAELGEFMDKKLKNFSSGMQVRLAFSIAVKAKNEILIFDEVLAVGDAAFQQKCFDYFEKLKNQKQTVIFVSHDMGAVRRFCNRALYLKDGNIIGLGSPTEIADIYAVENIQDAPAEDTTIDLQLPATYKINSKIITQNKNSLVMEFSYDGEADQRVIIGLGVLRDGISIAELSLPEDIQLVGKGRIQYTLDLTHLNPGSYQMSGSLFLHDTRRLMAVSPVRCSFVIKGNDPTKGSVLKLEHNWQVDE